MSTQPVHVGNVGGHRLRFFRICSMGLTCRGTASMNLHRCIGLDRNQRRYFLRRLREWGGKLRAWRHRKGRW